MPSSQGADFISESLPDESVSSWAAELHLILRPSPALSAVPRTQKALSKAEQVREPENEWIKNEGRSRKMGGQIAVG